jgi:hypothetical protein
MVDRETSVVFAFIALLLSIVGFYLDSDPVVHGMGMIIFEFVTMSVLNFAIITVLFLSGKFLYAITRRLF